MSGLTLFAATPNGVMAYNPDTGEWEPKALTQVLPDRELALLPPDPTEPHYGAAIRAEIAALRKTNATVWGPL